MIMNEIERIILKDSAVKHLNTHLKYIEAVPDGMEISSVTCFGVFNADDQTLDDVTKKLTEYRKVNGNYKVDGYRMYDETKLQVKYSFENGVNAFFYIKEAEAALEVLGKGRCKIVKKYVTPEPYEDVIVECGI